MTASATAKKPLKTKEPVVIEKKKYIRKKKPSSKRTHIDSVHPALEKLIGVFRRLQWRLQMP